MRTRLRMRLSAMVLLAGVTSSGCVTTARSPNLQQRQQTFAAPVPVVLRAAEVVLSRYRVPTDTLNLAAGELRGVTFFEESPWRDPDVARRVDCGATLLADNIAQDEAAISVRLDTFATPVGEGTVLEFRTDGRQGSHPCVHKRRFLAELFKAIELELATTNH